MPTHYHISPIYPNIVFALDPIRPLTLDELPGINLRYGLAQSADYALTVDRYLTKGWPTDVAYPANLKVVSHHRNVDLRSLAQACIDAGVHGPEDVFDRDYLMSENEGDSAYIELLRALTPEVVLALTSPLITVNAEGMDLADTLADISPEQTVVHQPADEFHTGGLIHGRYPYTFGEAAHDQAEVTWRANISGHLDLHGCNTEAQAMRAARWYHGLYGKEVPGEVGAPYRVKAEPQVTDTVPVQAFNYEVSDTVTVHVRVEGDHQPGTLYKKLIAYLDQVKVGGQ